MLEFTSGVGESALAQDLLHEQYEYVIFTLSKKEQQRAGQNRKDTKEGKDDRKEQHKDERQEK